MSGFPETQMCEDAPSVEVVIGTGTKRCGKCKKVKETSKFYVHRQNKDGLACYCKECQSKQRKARYAKNPKKENESNQKWKELNKDKRRKADCAWYARNKEKCAAYTAWYRENNIEKCKKISKHWQQRNPDKVREYGRRWVAADPERAKAKSRRSAIKARSTISGKLTDNIRRRIAKALHPHIKSGRTWKFLMGYTIDQLKKHIEKQFTGDMSWQNYGGQWHLDHIIPIKAFNFEKPEDEDFKKCWSLKNLQPMWAKENISKGAKLQKPFQPSLLL